MIEHVLLLYQKKDIGKSLQICDKQIIIRWFTSFP